VHLVGFIIRIYHEARSSECKKKVKLTFLRRRDVTVTSQRKYLVSSHQ